MNASAHRRLVRSLLLGPVVLLFVELTVVGFLPNALIGQFAQTGALAVACCVLLVVIGYGWAELLQIIFGRVRSVTGAGVFGYTLLTVTISICQTYFTGSRVPILVFLAGAFTGTLVGIWRNWSGLRAWPERRGVRLNRWVPTCLALEALLLACVPAVALGSNLPLIGENSDWSLYSLLARWWSIDSALELPRDPTYAAYIQTGVYFPNVGISSVVHYLSTLSIVTFRDPLDALVPGLIALRSLSVIALWHLCRRAFQWAVLPSIAACVLLVVTASQFEIIYDCYANQSAALVLLTAAMIGWIELVRRRNRQAVAQCGLFTAALIVGYAPLAPHFMAMAALVGLAALWTARRRLQLVGTMIAAACLSVLLSPGIWNLTRTTYGTPSFWLQRGNGSSYYGTWGSAAAGFAPPIRWIGLSEVSELSSNWLFNVPGAVLSSVVLTLVTVVVALMVVRGGAGNRFARASVVGAVIVGIGLWSYPFSYGFNKTTISLAFLTAVAFVGGLPAFGGLAARIASWKWKNLDDAHLASVARTSASAAFGVFAVALGASTFITVLNLASDPWAATSRQAEQLRSLLANVPTSSNVALPQGDAIDPRLRTVMGYALVPGSRPTGNYWTFNFDFFSPDIGGEQFALVRGGSLVPPGYQAQPRAAAGDFVLFQQDPDVIASQYLDVPIPVDQGRLLRISDAGSSLQLNDLQIRLPRPVPDGAQLSVDVLARVPTDITVSGSDGPRAVHVEAGQTNTLVGAIGPSEDLQLQGTVDEPVWIMGVTLATRTNAAGAGGQGGHIVAGAWSTADGKLGIELIATPGAELPNSVTFEIGSALPNQDGWTNAFGDTVSTSDGAALRVYDPQILQGLVLASRPDVNPESLKVQAFVIVGGSGIPVATLETRNGQMSVVATNALSQPTHDVSNS